VTEPLWLSVDQVLWLHALQIREFGGLPGVRDLGLLESALSRVRHRHHYAELTTVPELAVAYACAINSNHPFLDGNKRVSFHSLLVFLRMNGFMLNAEPSEATEMMLDLAAGRLKEVEVHAWIRTRLGSRSS